MKGRTLPVGFDSYDLAKPHGDTTIEAGKGASRSKDVVTKMRTTVWMFGTTRLPLGSGGGCSLELGSSSRHV